MSLHGRERMKTRFKSTSRMSRGTSRSARHIPRTEKKKNTEIRIVCRAYLPLAPIIDPFVARALRSFEDTSRTMRTGNQQAGRHQI